MAIPQAAQRSTDRRLELAQVLADLVADKLVSKEVADQLHKDRRVSRAGCTGNLRASRRLRR